MTDAQKRLRALLDKQSRDRQRAIELSREESLTDETRAELDEIETRAADHERQIRAARLAVDSEDDQSTVATGENTGDTEHREMLQLRSRAQVTRYLLAALKGRAPDGVEAEYREAARLPDDAPDNAIPMDLWDALQTEERAITAAPTSNTGVNLATLVPAVFAPSIAPFLSINMPMVPTGAYATGRIGPGATALAVAKGDDVPETAATWETFVTTGHRIGASLNLALEDIATVGHAGFEQILRQHISLTVSDQLDTQILNGDGSGNNIAGIITRLAAINNPTDPTADANFDLALAEFAAGIDGLWATSLADIGMLCGVATYRRLAQAFRDAGSSERNDTAFTTYAAQHTAGLRTNKRMPGAASNIQRAIICRKGRSMMPAPMQTAICPTWGYFTIDDIYTGARKGERRYVINTLIGDVILTQPDAYKLAEFKIP